MRVQLVLLLFFSCFSLHAEMSEKEIINYVESQVGVVIPKEQAREAYRVFESLFEKLSNAQSTMVESSSVSMNRFYLLSTPMVNAFVIPQKDIGKNRIYNRVFITTGLIRHMMNFSEFDFENKNYLHDTKLQEEVKYGILRVIGVIAHELAHPLDNVQHDKISIHDHYSRQGSQAIEIRADLEGAIITEKAGFSVEAVYLGLSRLFGEDRARGVLNAVATALSTHPSSHVRLSSQRLYLTLNRYETGLKTTNTPVDISDIRLEEFIPEVYNFKNYYQKFEYHPPTSLEDAVKRLEYVFYKTTDNNNLEINRLILSINQMLFEDYKSQDSKFIQRYFDMLYQFSLSENRRNINIYSSSDLHFKFTTKEMSKTLNTMRSHAWYLKNSAVYSDQKFLKPYLIDLKDQSLYLRKYIVKITEYSTHFLSEERTYKLISKRLKPYLKEGVSDKNRSLIVDIADLNDGWAKNKLYLDVYNAWFKGKAPTELINNLFFGRVNTGNFFPFTQTKKSISPYFKELKIKARSGNSEANKELDSYKSVMQDFIDNSKFWMAFELVGQKFIVDWRYIAEFLEINPDILISKLHNQAHEMIRELSKSNRNSELHKYLSSITKVINSSKTLKNDFRKSQATNHIQWMNAATINLLQNNTNAFDLFKGNFYTSEIATMVYSSNKVPNIVGSFLELYKAQFKEIVDIKKYNPYESHKRVYEKLFGQKLGFRKLELGALIHVHIEALEELGAPKKTLKKLIEDFFISKTYHDKVGMNFFMKEEPSTNQRQHLIDFEVKSEVFDLLMSGGNRWFKNYNDKYFNRTIDVIHKYYFSGNDVKKTYPLIEVLKERLSSHSSYYQFLVRLYKPIINEINAGERSILDWGKVVSSSVYRSQNNMDSASFNNSYELRKIKEAILTKASTKPMDTLSNYKLFLMLTSTGATIESDTFFKQHVMPHLKNKHIEKALINERIHSRDLVFEMAQKLLLPELDSIVSSKLEPSFLNAKIHKFLFKLNDLTKSDSFAKDKLLEDMAWRLELEGVRLSNFIEDEKTYNWRKASPSLINLSSLLAEVISSMNLEVRYDFIEFLRDPDKKPELLDKITEQIYRSSYSTFVASANLNPNKVHPDVKKRAFDFAQQARSQIQTYVYNSSASERMPVYELILSAGEKSVNKSEGYPLSFIRKSLNFEKQSNDERMLLTFLEMIPEHERTVSLAYLLSQSGEDKSDVKQLFKVFQSVGIKFGQLASIWNIFDEEINRQIRELKDDAGAMDKHRVIEAVRSYLPKKEFEKIVAWKRVLGSASIKTVVEVELVDGTRLALLVQNPNAKVQIESNITLSERFIEGLNKKGVTSSSALFEGLVSALKEQIFDEIRFDLEAEMIKKASKAYTDVSKTMDLKGWSFEVPKLSEKIHNNKKIMALELVSGLSFDQLSNELKPEVGRLIVESSLNMLFMHGLFDPDRHKGNQLIDVKNKVIHPIDFGQLQEFSKTSMFSYDDRLVLARFIEAVSSKRVKLMIEMAKMMSETNQVNDEKQLRLELERVLNSNYKVSQTVTEIVEAFAAQGIKFNKKFMFGGLKGLIILAGENYVSEAEFKNILKNQITKLYLQKWPQVTDVLFQTFKVKLGSMFSGKHENKSKMLHQVSFNKKPVAAVNSCRSLFK